MASHWTGFLKRRGTDRQPAEEASATPSARRERRVGVGFEVLQYEDGQPFIALVFMEHGKPLPLSGRLFTFDLQPGTTTADAEQLASILKERVTEFVETRAPQS